MRLKYIACLSVTLFILFEPAQGCCPTNGIAGGRKKRSVTNPTAPELSERLANFFGTCFDLVTSSVGILDSLKSVVDYTIRDTNWYRLFSTSLCNGLNDNTQCWTDALKYLLDERSKLYNSTASCISQWFKNEKALNRLRRDLTQFQAAHRVKRGISELSNPFSPWQPANKPLQCIERNSKQFLSRYPSLARVDGPSIAAFLEDHFTYCRILPEDNLYWRFFNLFACPTSGDGAAWRGNFTEVFTVATRTDGPLWASYQACLVSNWGWWRQVGGCSVTCGGGTQQWTRPCLNNGREVAFIFCPGGTDAALADTQCETQTCPINGKWSDWQDTTACGPTCGGLMGIKRQKRSCVSIDGSLLAETSCNGESSRVTECPDIPCPYYWTGYSLESECTYDQSTGSCSRTEQRYCYRKDTFGFGWTMVQPQSECYGDGERVQDCATCFIPPNPFDFWNR